MRHEKKRGKASAGLTEDFSFPDEFLKKSEQFTVCPNSTDLDEFGAIEQPLEMI